MGGLEAAPGDGILRIFETPPGRASPGRAALTFLSSTGRDNTPQPLPAGSEVSYLDVVDLVAWPDLIMGMDPLPLTVVAGFGQEQLSGNPTQHPQLVVREHEAREEIVTDWLMDMSSCHLGRVMSLHRHMTLDSLHVNRGSTEVEVGLSGRGVLNP